MYLIKYKIESITVMKISQFTTGITTKNPEATSYSYFLPHKINEISLEIDDAKLHTQLEKSARALGELNAMSKLVPDIGFYIHSFMQSEATMSTRIEGTRTSIEDSFMREQDVAPEKIDDWHDVVLYKQALEQAADTLQQLPICTRLIQQIHKTLMSSGRGNRMMPGEYRESQNWVGGSSLQTAEFIPPHHRHLGDLMGDLENFINNEETNMPQLARIGIIHYQFETIHPFLDGNGRVGRILIPLFLMQNKFLDKPLLYMSLFFEKYRRVYYDKLNRARTANALADWLLFFLEGVERTAQHGIRALNDVRDLRIKYEKRIRDGTGKRAANNLRLLDYLFKQPVINIQSIKNELKIGATAYRLIEDFIMLEIIKPFRIGKRARLFFFADYIKIFRRDIDYNAEQGE